MCLVPMLSITSGKLQWQGLRFHDSFTCSQRINKQKQTRTRAKLRVEVKISNKSAVAHREPWFIFDSFLIPLLTQSRETQQFKTKIGQRTGMWWCLPLWKSCGLPGSPLLQLPSILHWRHSEPFSSALFQTLCSLDLKHCLLTPSLLPTHLFGLFLQEVLSETIKLS